MFGAVHWFLVSQSYGSQYERFAWLYTVLDNLHRIAWHVLPAYRSQIPEKTRHGERPKALASTFRAPLPPSFSIPNGDETNVDALVKARNELIHEARWAGEPLGYAVSNDGHMMYQEMRHFCSQIILGLLEIPCEFRKTSYSRQRHGLEVTCELPLATRVLGA